MIRRHHFAIILVLMLCAGHSLASPMDEIVTLEGQFVCSECWFEADRSKVTYGTASDLECAKECAEKNIPPAVAVREGAGFRLYLIEAGRLEKQGDDWLEFIGKSVKVGGKVRREKDKHFVAVDRIEVTQSAIEQSALGQQPELTLKDLFGVEQKLSASRGRIVVLNFWATWCIPCRKEMPDLSAVQNDYAAFGVQVIGAAADSLTERAKVLEFIKETRINFPVWLGASTDDMVRFGLSPALPGTVVLGRDGQIKTIFPGVVSQPQLRKALDSLLAADSVALKKSKSAESETSRASLVPS